MKTGVISALEEELAKRVGSATSRLQLAAEQTGAAEHSSDTGLNAAADLGALLTDHKGVCIDVRTLARKMGSHIEEEIEPSRA